MSWYKATPQLFIWFETVFNDDELLCWSKASGKGIIAGKKLGRNRSIF